MGVSLKEAFENNILNSKASKIIPKECLYGNEIIFSDSLKEIQCSKKDCKCKVLYRIKHFCNQLDIKISLRDIKNIVDKLNIVSPYQMLLIDGAYDNNMITSQDSSCIYDLVKRVKDIKDNEYLFYELFRLCGINNISSIAHEIAYGFENTDELYNELEIGQLSFINERLGINSSDGCILSLDILNSLIEIKEEIIFAESVLKIKEYDKPRLFIAFNDNTDDYVNKQELLDVLNNKFNYTFVHVSVISNNTDILIKNLGNANNKFRTARLVNDKLIAEQINIGSIELNDIGKFREKQFKPVGSQIFIGSVKEIVDRLDYIKE